MSQNNMDSVSVSIVNGEIVLRYSLSGKTVTSVYAPEGTVSNVQKGALDALFADNFCALARIKGEKKFFCKEMFADSVVEEEIVPDVEVDTYNNFAHGIQLDFDLPKVMSELRWRDVFDCIRTYNDGVEMFRRYGKRESDLSVWFYELLLKSKEVHGVDYSWAKKAVGLNPRVLCFCCQMHGEEITKLMVSMLKGDIHSVVNALGEPEDIDFSDLPVDLHYALQVPQFAEGFPLMSDLQRPKWSMTMIGRHYNKFHSDGSNPYDGGDVLEPVFADFADRVEKQREDRKITGLTYLRLPQVKEVEIGGQIESVRVMVPAEHPILGKVLAVYMNAGESPKIPYKSLYERLLASEKAMADAKDNASRDRATGWRDLFVSLYKQYVMEANDARNIVSWHCKRNGKQRVWYRSFDVQTWMTEGQKEVLGFSKDTMSFTLFSVIMDSDLKDEILNAKRETSKDWNKIKSQAAKQAEVKKNKPKII